ncbi:MAG: hypothetical protein V3U46_11725 [Acidimicrobiia bacterium]
MVGSDEQAVKAALEQFLEAAGSHDLDAVEEMVVSNANVGWASLRDGKLFVGEKAERHNIDYFTLIKTNGVSKVPHLVLFRNICRDRVGEYPSRP